MDSDVFTVEPARSLDGIYWAMAEGSPERRQRLYPVIDASGGLVGILRWSAVLAGRQVPDSVVGDVMEAPVAVAYPDEILRAVADRMAGLDVGVIPVIDRRDRTRLAGLITQFDLLRARQKLLEEERHAERVLTVRRVTVAPQSTDPTDGAGGGATDDALPAEAESEARA
jgi:CBS domain-containing protein